jgi:hypothetical protein
MHTRDDVEAAPTAGSAGRSLRIASSRGDFLILVRDDGMRAWVPRRAFGAVTVRDGKVVREVGCNYVRVPRFVRVSRTLGVRRSRPRRRSPRRTRAPAGRQDPGEPSDLARAPLAVGGLA